MSDGQHRDDGMPSINNGQRTREAPDVKVGHGGRAHVGNLSGGEEHGGSIRSVPLDADISTTTHSAGVLRKGEHPGADDKK